MDKESLTRTEKIVLVILPIMGVILSLGYRLSYIASVFLFYFLPGFYLDISRSAPRSFVKHLLFATIVALPFVIIVDYVGVQSGLWYVPHSIFPSRFLGILPYEDFFWMISAVYTIIALYADNRKKDEKAIFNGRMRWFILSAGLILVIFFILIQFYPALFVWHTRWAYATLATVFFLLPVAIWLNYHCNLFRKVIPVVLYFFLFTLCFEIIGARLKDWVFEGLYLLPPLAISGLILPYEELFFVGIIGPIAAVAFYDLLA
jgi:hypothetical protein